MLPAHPLGGHANDRGDEKLVTARSGRAGPAKARRLALAVLRVSRPALLAVAACLFCYLVGWRGTDWAAQNLPCRRGCPLWDLLLGPRMVRG